MRFNNCNGQKLAAYQKVQKVIQLNLSRFVEIEKGTGGNNCYLYRFKLGSVPIKIAIGTFIHFYRFRF